MARVTITESGTATNSMTNLNGSNHSTHGNSSSNHRVRPRRLGKGATAAGPPAIRNTSVKSRSRLPNKNANGDAANTNTSNTGNDEPPRHGQLQQQRKKNASTMSLQNGYVSSGMAPSMMLASTSSAGNKKRPKVIRANTLRQGQQWNSVLLQQPETGSTPLNDAPNHASNSNKTHSKRRVAPPRTNSDSATAFQPPTMLNGQQSDRRLLRSNSSSNKKQHSRSNLAANKTNSSLSQLQIMQQATRQQQQTSRRNVKKQPPTKSTNNNDQALGTQPQQANHDFSNTVISTTPEQRSMMRQISALGLEDPVFDRLLLQNASNITESVPDDMKEFMGSPVAGGTAGALGESHINNNSSKQGNTSSRSNNTKATYEFSGSSEEEDCYNHHNTPATRRNTNNSNNRPRMIPPKSPSFLSSSRHNINSHNKTPRKSRRASADMLSSSSGHNSSNTPKGLSKQRSKTPTRIRQSLRSLFHSNSNSKKDISPPFMTPMTPTTTASKKKMGWQGAPAPLHMTTTSATPAQ